MKFPLNSDFDGKVNSEMNADVGIISPEHVLVPGAPYTNMGQL